MHMNSTEKPKTHVSSWPTKLTSVMDIHRYRLSQLNPKFKQQQTDISVTQPTRQSVLRPTILPPASRPKPRQQARLKPQQQQTHLPPTNSSRRSNTSHNKQQQLQSESNHQYITLANLTKFLHVLQTQVKLNDSERSTDTSTSSANSAKQRVQQHLQETAVRWWKPSRSSDSQPAAPPPPLTMITAHTTANPKTQLSSSNEFKQQPENLPLITVVSDSTRRLDLPSTNDDRTSKYDEYESIPDTQRTSVRTSHIQTPKRINTKRTRYEPLIIQSRGLNIHSYDNHNHYNNPNHMKYLQQNRLIRQT